jgi:hypothetical protein
MGTENGNNSEAGVRRGRGEERQRVRRGRGRREAGKGGIKAASLHSYVDAGSTNLVADELLRNLANCSCDVSLLSVVCT